MNLDIHLRLRHIRCFLEIAREESISRAADRLHITQPAVSRTLMELERMLDTRLFDRVGRGIRLNEAGRIFQSHAAASLVELQRGRDRLSSASTPAVRLSVGVLPTAAPHLLPDAALVFRQAMPNGRLHVLTGPNWLLFNQLRDGTLDLVVGRLPENEAGKGVTFEQLYIEHVVLVCRPGHEILAALPAERRLSDFPLILPPRGAVIARAVDRYLASVGLPEMHGSVETVSLPVGRRIVQRSDALWFISRGVVAEELDIGLLRAVDLGSPILAGPVGISTARSAPPSAARSLLTDCLRQVAASHH